MKRKVLLAIGAGFVVFLAAIIPWKGEGSANTRAEKRRFTFSYQLSISDLPPDADNLEIWIPFPPSNGYQKIENYQITTPLPHRMYVDPDYGNRILDIRTTDQMPENVEIRLDFEVTRLEASSFAGSGQHQSADQFNLKRFLAPDELVPIDGKIAKEAQQVVDDRMSPLEKVEALYEHLTQTLNYDKTGQGWGHGNALYACDFRKGNCTDIHSLFIGMARSCRIPARFIIGFPLPEKQTAGEIAGYHCWAEFYIEQRGWIPVDISEAIKHPEKKAFYFGGLDPDRISFTTGRDIKLQTSYGHESLNFFIYPYILVDGEPFEQVNYNFYFSQN